MSGALPCPCMVTGEFENTCRQCHGDWYACECVVKHARWCSDDPDFEPWVLG